MAHASRLRLVIEGVEERPWIATSSLSPNFHCSAPVYCGYWESGEESDGGALEGAVERAPVGGVEVEVVLDFGGGEGGCSIGWQTRLLGSRTMHVEH